MRLHQLEKGGEEEWNGFVARQEGLLGHKAEWAAILSRSFGHKPRFLMASGEEGIRGILPLARVDGIVGGKALVSLPWLDASGVLASDDEARRALLDRACNLAAEEDCRYLEIRSLREYEYPRPVKTSKVLMQLPLEDEEPLWQSFSAKVRNQIRKAEKNGLTALAGGEDELDAFYRVFSRNMRDIGVPVWGRDFFEEIIHAFSDTARVIVVRDKTGLPVGGALMLLHGKTAHVPSASSLRTHFKLCPNHLLYWTALRTARAMGADLFDFGRSSPDSGTWRFKKQWGSHAIPSFWHYDLKKIDSPPERNTASRKLRLAVETWKRLPLPIANRLGPLVVRRIP